MKPSLLLTTSLLLLSGTALAKKRPKAPDLQATAQSLIESALNASEAYEELRALCDDIGHRISGSVQLQQAEEWAAKEMAADGLTVTKEDVPVEHWIRGETSGEVLTPRAHTLGILALGGSASTPEGGLEAEAIVVHSFEELEERSDEAKGRIVVFDVPFTTYSRTVKYRWGGAAAAAKHGAVASLVRSVTPVSLHSPHTGSMGYPDDVEVKIPHAAITLEDSEFLSRLADRGIRPKIRLNLQSTTESEIAHNVVGEIKGREKPDEIIVLGCHLDSWDVGQGAQDDGAGCVTVMEAGAQLAALPVAPRRTVRVVLYTNEENGLAGGKAYAAAHEGETFVAVLEDDTGSGQPLGFNIDLPGDGEPDKAAIDEVKAWLAPVSAWLEPLGAGKFAAGYSGADVGKLVNGQTLGFGLRHDMTGYWPIHHTEADTFEKVDPELMKKNTAAVTAFAWFLAETESYPQVP